MLVRLPVGYLEQQKQEQQQQNKFFMSYVKREYFIYEQKASLPSPFVFVVSDHFFSHTKLNESERLMMEVGAKFSCFGVAKIPFATTTILAFHHSAKLGPFIGVKKPIRSFIVLSGSKLCE